VENLLIGESFFRQSSRIAVKGCASAACLFKPEIIRFILKIMNPVVCVDRPDAESLSSVQA
jgi:hypothetical protein